MSLTQYLRILAAFVHAVLKYEDGTWNISVGSGVIIYISNMYFHSKIKVTNEIIAVL